jgi:hypothetical protein
VSLGARVTGASVSFRGEAVLDEGHVLRSVLKPGSPMALSRALSTSPIGLVEASIDGAALAPLIRDFMGSLDVMDYDALKELVLKRYELNLDRDLLERLGGAFGMSFAMKGDTLSTSFTAGITDDAAVKGLLDRMAAAERTQEFLRTAHRGEVSAWTLPWFEGEAVLRLEKGRATLSNDTALADRVLAWRRRRRAPRRDRHGPDCPRVRPQSQCLCANGVPARARL